MPRAAPELQLRLRFRHAGSATFVLAAAKPGRGSHTQSHVRWPFGVHARNRHPFRHAMTTRLALIVSVLTAFCTPASAQIENRKPPNESRASVSIAAASDLIFCLEDLHAAFAQAEPAAALAVVTGSSGNFFAQIKNGAPFDVFLSADVRYPRELAAAGAADTATITRYAIGQIVLWTKRTDLDPADLAAVVRSRLVQKFAIANPAHAPYGRAAQQALEKLGVWADAQPKLVFGENIVQTAQFVQTGNADAGIVALSLVLAPNLRQTGRWVEIPPSLYDTLEQAAVLTSRGSANPAARRYLTFLGSPAARAIFERYGFRLPAPAL